MSKTPDFDFLALAGAMGRRPMEAADFDAAFEALFPVLRTNVRRGFSNRGQLYALEMDACMPGELLGSQWIPPASRGISPPALASAPRRRAILVRLLAEPRPETLIAYVCERSGAAGEPVLYLEVASATASHGAEYPIGPGAGWHRRELLPAQHRCLDAA